MLTNNMIDESMKKHKKKKVSLLDFSQYFNTSSNVKLNLNNVELTPRSHEACLKQGISIQNLVKKELEDFKSENGNDNEQILLKRYQFYENQRKASMNAVLRERKEIIKQNKRKQIFAAITAKSLQNSPLKNADSYQQRDKIALEKMRQRQKEEIQQTIKAEILRQLREQEREKEELKHENEMLKQQRQLLEKQKEIEQLRKEKEKEKRENELKLEKLHNQEMKKQLLKEKQQKIENEKKEKLHKMEIEKKQKELQQKKDIREKEIEQRQTELENEKLRKLRELEKKEKERQAALKEQLKLKQEEQLIKSQKIQQRIENQKEINEKLEHEKLIKLKEKEEHAEKRRKEFEKQKENEFIQQQKIADEKKKRIEQIQKKNELIMEQKQIEFENRMNEIEERKKIQELENKKWEKYRQKKLYENEQKRKAKLQKSLELEEENRQKLLEKFEERAKQIELKKKQREKQELLLQEESKLKDEQRHSILERMQKMEQYKRDKYETELNEKLDKIQKLKQEKKMQKMERRRLQTETRMQKKLLSEAMAKLRQSSRLSEINADTLETLSVLDLFRIAKIEIDPAIETLLQENDEKAMPSTHVQSARKHTPKKSQTMFRNSSFTVKKIDRNEKAETPLKPASKKKHLIQSQSSNRMRTLSDTQRGNNNKNLIETRSAHMENYRKKKLRPQSAAMTTHSKHNSALSYQMDRTLQDRIKTLNDLQTSLHRRLMWVIEQEEVKEEERCKLLMSITDSTERIRLDKIFGYERRNAALKIQNLKNENERIMKQRQAMIKQVKPENHHGFSLVHA